MRVVRLAVPVLVVCCLLAALSPAVADGGWRWPLGSRAVGGAFDLPDSPYGAGHRGVDLPGVPGEQVRAVAAGRVLFSGTVGGLGVVTVGHGAERSTYQPVLRRVVRRGDAVQAGQVLGRLAADGSHCVSACLHLGRVRGETYLDPVELLGGSVRFRLVDPTGPPPRPPAVGSGDLSRPVAGPVTSPFGMRVHPVTGVRKLHDGVDLGAPCGTPVRAAAAGTVRSAGRDGAYGIRVVLTHGAGLRTAYAHLSRASVSPGQRVSARTIVGRVGSTGLSTGCHLHLMALRDGRPVDPLPLL